MRTFGWRRKVGLGLLIVMAVAGVAVAAGSRNRTAEAARAAAVPNGDLLEIDLGEKRIDDVYVIVDRTRDAVSLVGWDGTEYYSQSLGAVGLTGRPVKTGLRETEHVLGGLQRAIDSTGRVWLASGERVGYLSTSTKSFIEVPLPKPTRRLPETPELVTSANLPAWKNPRVTSLALDDADRLWITRDFCPDLVSVDPTSTAALEVIVPGDPQVMGNLAGTQGKLFLASLRQLPGQPERRLLFDPATGDVTELDIAGPIASVDPSAVWTRELSGSTRVSSAQMIRTEAAAHNSPVASPGVSSHPMAFMKSDGKGGVWYLGEKTMEVLRHDTVTGSTVSYSLPYEEFGTSAPGEFKPFPEVFSAEFDSRGNLWLSYSFGYRHVVRLSH